jgi:hypothetical protein
VLQGIALSRRQGITHQGHFQASRAMTPAAKRGVPTLVLMQRGWRQGPAGVRLSILAPTTVAFTLVGPSNLPRRKPSVINGRLDQLSHFHALSRQTSRARGEHTEGGPADHIAYLLAVERY